MKHILTAGIKPTSIYFAPADDDAGTPGEKKEPIHISKEAKEFGKRFAPPPEMVGKPPKAAEPPPQETPDEKTARESREAADAEKAETERAERERLAEERRASDPRNSRKREPGQPGFVKTQIERAKAAEAERDQFKAKVEKFEKEELPALQSKIKEYEGKIASGNFSPAKETEMQDRIKALETERDEKLGTLQTELENTRKRLQIYSLTDDPVYKEKYVRPLGESIEALNAIAGTNQVLKGAMQRAMMAQRAVISASTPEERATAEAERDEQLENMMGGLGSVQQRRLNAAFDKFMESSEAQALALAEHEKTSLQIRKEAEQRFKEGTLQTVREWTQEYNAQETAFAEDFAIDGELQAKMDELGLKVDMKAEDTFARGAIEGKLKKAEVVKLIHRGRAYETLKAKTKAQAAMIEGLKSTITKLQGASPGGGSRSGPTPPAAKPTAPTNHEGKDRKAWQQRFKPPQAAPAS